MLNRIIQNLSVVKSLNLKVMIEESKVRCLQNELEAERAKHQIRPARIVVQAGLSEDAIASMLNGTETLPVNRAITGLLTAKIIELSDTATDRPRPTIQLADQVVQGYTTEERLHDAGGASHLADMLARIQELSKPKELEKIEAAT